MVSVTFRVNGADVVLHAAEGDNLLDAARRANVAIDAPCSGNGACGKCRVKLLSGDLDSPQTRHITDEEYAQGWRLSCVSKLTGDVVVEVPDIASAYRSRMKVADISSEKELAIFNHTRAEIAEAGIEMGNNLSVLTLALTEPTIDDTMPDNERLSRKIMEETGAEKVEVTYAALKKLARVLRENAFKAYYKRAGEFRNTYASTLDAQFKQLKFFADARHYNSTLEASLDVTEVPVEVYTNLIDAVHGNLDKMYRYVELRKKILGVDALHMYDVYTPIVADADVEISFEEAKKTALEALAVLGKDYTDVLEEAFSNRWLDVYENTGKRGGAYCTGNGWPHPYVLLNHKDNLDSMFTLVHEMGHAMHTWHSCKYQPVNTAEYVIFVAEVASTCNEILLMRHLLGKTDDRKQRAYLINHFLDQFKGTLYRQTMFAEFELQMGKMAESGEALTADALSAKYLALNKLYFGDTMISDDEIALEWTRIPHFYYNYYVFQYATSFSAAVAIANRILREGESAAKDYKKFLSGGCSKEPVELLRDMGVDMRTSAPVNDALSLFGELIDELSALLG